MVGGGGFSGSRAETESSPPNVQLVRAARASDRRPPLSCAGWIGDGCGWPDVRRPPRQEFANTSSMDTFNLFRDETSGDESDPPGYRAQSAQLAPRFGASRLAMTVYDLPSGQAICPYHFHWGDEEWLVVVSGTPTVRTPNGEQ